MRVASLFLVAIAAALCAISAEATQEAAAISNAAPSKRFLAVFGEVQRADGLAEILGNSIETHNKIRELLVRWCMEDHGSENSSKSILKRNKRNKLRVKHDPLKRAASKMYARLTHHPTSRNLREASIDCKYLDA
ncbi:unnamed protein product [Hyaloperonospora brassicae]|uniref:RxLR effector protein n=1 Tax=Hyaloperonospora brassicae TaxID=162125 RepID=A0AAV0UJH5_HYABA|nr:unnamed protein product [Hyaloperonospora brassicae]